jgi:hypothetical protein
MPAAVEVDVLVNLVTGWTTAVAAANKALYFPILRSRTIYDYQYQ